MSLQFKHWLVFSAVATVAMEIMVYFMFTPETRNNPVVQSLMWLILPFPSVLYALIISVSPIYRNERKALTTDPKSV